MLLAFSARPEELEVLLISLTFGNVGVQKYGWLFFLFSLFSHSSVPIRQWLELQSILWLHSPKSCTPGFSYNLNISASLA